MLGRRIACGVVALLVGVGAALASGAGARESTEPGGPWHDPVRLVRDASLPYDTSVFDPTGRVSVAWVEDGTLWVRSLLPDGTLLPRHPARHGLGEGYFEQVAVASMPHGASLVVWPEPRDDPSTFWPNDNVLLARRIGLDGELGPVLLVGRGLLGSPEVVADPRTGRAIVTWINGYDPADHRRRLEGRILFGPGETDAPRVLSTRDNASTADIEMNASGHAVISWMQNGGGLGGGRLWARRVFTSGGVGPETLLSPAGIDADGASRGATTLDRDGTVRALYTVYQPDERLELRSWELGEQPGARHLVRTGFINYPVFGTNDDGWSLVTSGSGKKARYIRPGGAMGPWFVHGIVEIGPRPIVRADRTALLGFEEDEHSFTRTVHPGAVVRWRDPVGPGYGPIDFVLTESGRAVATTAGPRGLFVSWRRFER